MKKTVALIIVALIVVSLSLTACGGQKDALVGDWYLDEYDEWYATFYSDGTCKVRGEYGTCTWDIIDGEFRITNFYGQMESTENFSINGDELIINGTVLVKK